MRLTRYASRATLCNEYSTNSSLHASDHSFHRGASKVPIMSSDGAPAITQVSTAGILASNRTRSLRVQFVLAAAAEKRWRMNARLLAGIALGLGGVALLFGRSTLMAGPGMATAAVVTLLGALSWAVGIVYSRKSHLSGHPLLLSALSLISGALLLLLAGTVAGEGRVFHFAAVSHRSWMALAYLILFGSVIAFTAYNWLLEHYSPTLVATHTYVNPIVAVLRGWVLAQEARALVSGCVVALRFFARVPPPRRAHTPPHP